MIYLCETRPFLRIQSRYRIYRVHGCIGALHEIIIPEVVQRAKKAGDCCYKKGFREAGLILQPRGSHRSITIVSTSSRCLVLNRDGSTNMQEHCFFFLIESNECTNKRYGYVYICTCIPNPVLRLIQTSQRNSRSFKVDDKNSVPQTET